MNKKLTYPVLGIALILFSFFVIFKIIKKLYTPQINLSSLTLKGLDLNDIQLAKFTGKPLVINFWGTWCGPCRQELPFFERAKNKYGNQINFIEVSDEGIDKLKKFKQQNPYTFLYAQSQMPFHQLGITSVPFTYIYNAEGKIIYKKKDVLSEIELNHLIDQVLLSIK